jgi:hypothetical protein
MANVTPFLFFRTCWLGGCERAEHAEAVEAASTAAPEKRKASSEETHAKEAGILRRSRDAHSARDKGDLSLAVSPPIDSPGRKDTSPDTRMPDFVFGVLRTQAVNPVPRHAGPRHPDEIHGQLPCPVTSVPNTAAPACASTDSLKKVPAQLFTSYALKARR